MIIHAIKRLEKERDLILNGKSNFATVEEIEQSIEILKQKEKEQNKKRRYETELKLDNKWVFLGWTTMKNEDFCIETKLRGKYIYKTYKWMDGSEEQYRYGSYLDEEE